MAVIALIYDVDYKLCSASVHCLALLVDAYTFHITLTVTTSGLWGHYLVAYATLYNLMIEHA